MEIKVFNQGEELSEEELNEVTGGVFLGASLRDVRIQIIIDGSEYGSLEKMVQKVANLLRERVCMPENVIQKVITEISVKCPLYVLDRGHFEIRWLQGSDEVYVSIL